MLKEGGGLVPGERGLSRGMEREVERKYFGVVVEGGRSGRKIRLPREAPREIERREEEVEDTTTVEKEEPSPLSSNLMMVAGELLHILRPVTSHKLAGRFGAESFVPWVIALMMDMMSNHMSNKGLEGKAGQRKDEEGTVVFSPNHPTSNELRRRKMRWMLYLLRAPVWGKFGNDVVKMGEKVSVPGTKWLMNWVLGWLVYVQKHHFMLESTI